MAKKKVVEPVPAPTAVMVAPPLKKEIILEGDPEAQLAFASKAANALMTIVAKKPNPVMIRGKQYLEFGDWQVLARFYGATVEIEWTKPIESDGKIIGYEARALVRRQGETISSAENMCMRDEKRWRDADEYAVRSMAQTRTAAKALRNAFGWVAELAGYAATPLEEMPPEMHEPMKSYKVARTVPAADDEAGGAVIQMEVEEKPKGYPKMTSANDAHGLDEITKPPTKEELAKAYDEAKVDISKEDATAMKMQIARLLKEKFNFVMLGKTAYQVEEKVMAATGIKLEPQNYIAIINELKSL